MMPEEMPHLVKDADPAPDIRRHGRAGDPELRERSPAEDEARPEGDVERVREPQRAHREHGVASTAEDRVDQEDHEHGHVAAEHDAREVRAELDDCGAGAHEPQNVRSEPAKEHPEACGDRRAEDDDLRR